MAAWTQQDVDSVRAAVLDLVTGKRATTVTFAGPPQRTVQYAAVELDKLEALLAKMERAVSGTPTFRRASFNKGFDGAGE